MERTNKFTIGSKSFVAKFPNVGQIIDIDSMKQALSSNRYGNMAASGVVSAYFALDLIDAISFLTIVCPDVQRYFDIKNYTTMQIDEINEIVKAYTEQIRPWYDKTMNELKGISTKSQDGETEGAA